MGRPINLRQAPQDAGFLCPADEQNLPRPAYW
jgi:hypothetical protein